MAVSDPGSPCFVHWTGTQDGYSYLGWDNQQLRILHQKWSFLIIQDNCPWNRKWNIYSRFLHLQYFTHVKYSNDIDCLILLDKLFIWKLIFLGDEGFMISWEYILKRQIVLEYETMINLNFAVFNSFEASQLFLQNETP